MAGGTSFSEFRVIRMTREVGVAAIPLSAFYGDGFDQRVVRFCFAKQDATLHAAIERLRKL